MSQPTLFESPITSGTHRHADPWSSRESARRTDTAPAKEIILAAFVANGGYGTLDVAHDAMIEAGHVRTQRGTLSRRISDLDRDGSVRETGRYVDGSYGQPIAVWQVVV